VNLLSEAGHDVLTVNQSRLTSRPDVEVLEFAVQSGRVLLTRNAQDFFILHKSNTNHLGILAEYQDQDGSKNMSAPEVVRAVSNIERSGWEIAGQFISLNAWLFEPPTG
jgi:hypothetical protein